ncbi:MAG: VCBS repeat-containing protein, partial [Armatimonadetes bacterium]|nr:VCBS repeat-containing protein [Armatimonadota bacterium]
MRALQLSLVSLLLSGMSVGAFPARGAPVPFETPSRSEKPVRSEGTVRFEAQTIDPAFGIGYAVTLADMNGDRRTDIVGVSEN